MRRLTTFAKKHARPPEMYADVRMRVRSLSFVGRRPIDLINHSVTWQLPEESDVNQKILEASDFGLLF